MYKHPIQSAFLTLIIMFAAVPVLGQERTDLARFPMEQSGIEFKQQHFEVRGSIAEIATYRVFHEGIDLGLDGVILTLDSGISLYCALFSVSPCAGLETGDEIHSVGEWHFSSTLGRVRWTQTITVGDLPSK